MNQNGRQRANNFNEMTARIRWSPYPNYATRRLICLIGVKIYDGTW